MQRQPEVNTVTEVTDDMRYLFKNAFTGALIAEVEDAYDLTACWMKGEELERELGCVFDTYDVEVEFSYPPPDREDWLDERYKTYTRISRGPAYMYPGEIGQRALEHEQERWQNDEIALEDVRSP